MVIVSLSIAVLVSGSLFHYYCISIRKTAAQKLQISFHVCTSAQQKVFLNRLVFVNLFFMLFERRVTATNFNMSVY